MAALYEIREKIILLFRQYENLIVPIVKFAAVAAGLLFINSRIGYMNTINSILPVLIAALICSLAPTGMAVIIYAVFILLHLYALSIEAAAVGAALMLFLLLLYFRFAPKDSMLIVLFPAACALGVPYALVFAGGLLYGPYAALTCAACFIVREFCSVIADNDSALGASADAADILNRFRMIVDALMNNKKILVLAASAILAVLVVYVIRRLAIKYSWYIAIAAGTLLQIITILTGVLKFGISLSMAGLFGGIVFSALIAVVITFLVFNLDYSRIENTQFEDAEYYYYVRAIPKINLSEANRTVKNIGSSGKKSSHKVSAEPLREEYDSYDNGDYYYEDEYYEPEDDYYEDE